LPTGLPAGAGGYFDPLGASGALPVPAALVVALGARLRTLVSPARASL
jgi:hypothetical protein